MLCVLCGCFFVIVSALPQTGASRVALATVVDPRNRPIVDVEADDFVVHEGADAREILSVHVADYPVVVMLDTSGDARSDLPAMQKAAAQFITRIGHRPVALGSFGDPPAMLASLDDERPALMERLDGMPASETGPSMLLQGAALAAHTLRPIGSLFTAIVMLSATAVDASRDADALVAPIVESGAMLHVIANRSNRASSGSPGGADAALHALVDQTHGQYTTIYTAASYRVALDHLADRLATEIMIEYLVPPQSKANDVKIGVRIPGARVRGFGVAPR